jgi:hypothetical protein
VRPGEGRRARGATLRRLAIAAATALAGAAEASPLLELPTVRDRCRPEIERFCADVPAEEGALASCLAARRLELSGECRGGLAARAVRRWAWRGVCHADLARFCLGSMRHDERALECLEANAWKVDPLCRTRTRVAVVWAERILERLEWLRPRAEP